MNYIFSVKMKNIIDTNNIVLLICTFVLKIAPDHNEIVNCKEEA